MHDNHCTNIANNSLENLTKGEYMGTTVTNSKYISDKVELH